MLVFVIFLVLRYYKETKFYRALKERADDLDLATLTTPDSPFEHIIENSMTMQTEELKKTAAHNRLLLEQEKDEFLAWIHEVKTPLTAMHLMLDRIDNEALKSDMTHEWLRIHLLLDQQLHQKRIPFMENDLYIEEVDLESILFLEIKTLRSWCMQKSIGFDIDLDASSVLSDAKWLSFILRQILTNAVKYSEGADILIRSNVVNDQVSLAIQDFGRGIDDKDMPRIFDKGFTSTTVHYDHAATGMGLYLTKQVAKPLLLKIDVDSQIGIGTTFIITFPIRNDFVDLES